MAEAATEQFVRLFARHQRDLFRYVLTLVANVEDAHEVLQETAAALWRKFDQYRPEEPFVPWARKFAYFEVLKFRRRHRYRGALLEDQVIELLAEQHATEADALEQRRHALGQCLEKLPEKDRELIQLRYWHDTTLQEVSEQSGRSVHMLYKSLVRIRRQLFDCINRSLATEAGG